MKRVNCFQVFKIMKLLMLFVIKKKIFCHIDTGWYPWQT